MSPLQRGDTLNVTVEKGVYRGLGLARHDGQVIFVPRGLPGDRVDVRIESVTPGFARASLQGRLEDGPGRRTSPCPYVPRCGGCAYQELDYPGQLALKQAILRESLARAGIPWEGPIEMAGSEEEGWRTRATFHFQSVGGTLRLGLHEETSHAVVDLERCLQISGAMNRAARGLLRAIQDRPGTPSRVRHLELAESVDGAGLVAALHTDLAQREAAGVGSLAEGAPGLTGFGVVPARGHYLSLRGDPHVETTVGGLRLRSHVLSFFQANRFLVAPLAKAVVEATPPGGTVLDLYTGVGLFALSLSATAERVLGAEWSRTALEDARANAERAGLGNVAFREGHVMSVLGSWPVTLGERVILDPPRSGAGLDVVRAVAARHPVSVVYVSCDPPTLGRDLKAFAELGYRPSFIRAFDLFPDTFHLETVVALLPG
jgi:23S rRNA (uracil1939-C5)-methyltransferase